jgi:TetR/AcrR family transcriptional regulator
MSAKKMSGEQRREQIILAAVELFAEKGFAEVTTREIAAAAGINEATIYKYFASKEDLFDAVVTHFGAIMSERFGMITLDTQRNIGEIYQELAEGMISYMRKDPRIIRLMMYSGLQEHRFADSLFRQTGGDVLKKVQDFIRKGQEEGVIRPDLDPVYLSLAMVAMIIYYNIARILILKGFFKDLVDRKYIETIAEVLLHGILTQSSGDES